MIKSWINRPVFVTGCNGFLGSWLSRELIDRGADIVGLVRDRTSDSMLFAEGYHQRMTIVNGQVEDLPMLERVLNEYEVETVFHIAAQTLVMTAYRHPVSTFESNVRGTWNLLDACRRTPSVSRIVIASSDKAYGVHDVLPYTEEAALQGTHPYDVSKSCADLIALAYHTTYQLPVCVTRCGNLYGGGDLNFSRLVPGTIRSALRDEAPVIRSDGSHVRDYLYVRDAVLAYLDLADRMDEDGVAGKAFNFSNESQITVLEMVQLLLEVVGRPDLSPTILGGAQHEIPRQMLSAERARTVLGWHPQYELAEGLAETVEWYRANLKEHSNGVRQR